MGWLLLCIVVSLASVVGFAMYVVSDAFVDEDDVFDGEGCGCVHCDDAHDPALIASKVKA